MEKTDARAEFIYYRDRWEDAMDSVRDAKPEDKKRAQKTAEYFRCELERARKELDKK
jgi:hypothetical protein